MTEPKYNGSYLIRVGQFYWLHSIRDPNNAYEHVNVKGVYGFSKFTIVAEGETEEEIFTLLNLYNDQVIMSIEKL